jgi:hypothetical protein
LKIELDERELEIMLDAIHVRMTDLEKMLAMASRALNSEISDQLCELEDLSNDLREMLRRDDDGWDRDNDAVPDAAAEFIQAGIDAREQVKASSRAEARHNERMMAGTASGAANDPIDW